MNKLKFLLAAFAFVMITIGIYSCAKEGVEQKREPKDSFSAESVTKFHQTIWASASVQNKLENRSITSSPCFPTATPGVSCVTNTVTNQSMNLPVRSFPGTTIPNRPSCSNMVVSYEITICSDFSVYISDFDAQIGNCPSLIAWFNALTSAQKAEMKNVWDFELGQNLELQYVTAAGPSLQAWFGLSDVQLKCENSPVLSISFIEDICFNSCLVQQDGFPFFKIIKSKCGNQCCKRQSTICKGQGGTGQFILQNTVFTAAGDPCTNSPTICKLNSLPLSKFCGIKCGIR